MKKLVIDSSLASDSIHNELSVNNSRLSRTQSQLSRMFEGEDLIHGINGFHKEESKQFSKEVFSSLFENSDRIESQKSWAKTIFDSVENSDMYRQLRKHCLHNKEKSSIATSRLINEISISAKELRAKQQQEEIDFDDDDIDIEFDDADLDSIDDILNRISPKIISSFNEDDELGKMLAIGHDMSSASPEKGKSVGKDLLQSVKRNRALLEVFKKAGSLLLEMDSKKVKDQSGMENLIGIEQGRDLRTLTTGSRSLLCNPVTETVFYDKFCRNQLDVFDYEGEIDKSRGAIILLIDESASMSDSNRNEIASAIGIAFTHLAVKEERPITIVGFNRNVTNVYQVKNKKCMRNEKEIQLSDLLMEIATRRPCGGTSFDTPINTALNLNPNEQKADLIMITDGHAQIFKETIDRINEYKREGMKFYSVLLGCDPKSLLEVSDEIIDIEKLSAENQGTAGGSILNSVRS